MPFMGFATHRLGLRSPIPARDFLNAMERGNALHWVMEHYFQRYPESSLACRSQQHLLRNCEQAIARYKHLPEPLIAAEQSRLTQLVTDWLAIEAKRNPFRVVETEQRYTLELGDLFLICELTAWMRWTAPWCSSTTKQDASQLLLPWANPSAPQLPSYALIREDIAGVYYAQVRNQEQKLIGIAGEPEQLAEGKNSASQNHRQNQARHNSDRCGVDT